MCHTHTYVCPTERRGRDENYGTREAMELGSCSRPASRRHHTHTHVCVSHRTPRRRRSLATLCVIKGTETLVCLTPQVVCVSRTLFDTDTAAPQELGNLPPTSVPVVIRCTRAREHARAHTHTHCTSKLNQHTPTHTQTRGGGGGRRPAAVASGGGAAIPSCL